VFPFSANLKILYGTVGGMSKNIATELKRQCEAKGISAEIKSLAEYDIDDLRWERAVIFVVSTYEGGTAATPAQPFMHALTDLSLDFRVSKTHLKPVHCAVFGLGHRDYAKNFNKAAKNLHRAVRALSAQSLVPPAFADVSSSVDIMVQLQNWIDGKAMDENDTSANARKPLLDEIRSTLQFKANAVSSSSAALVESDSEDESAATGSGENEMVDVEDLSQGLIKPAKKGEEDASDSEDDSFDESDVNKYEDVITEKEMLTPSLRKALSKQGYRLLGTHSGVKLCRWTKAMLRGRGGCYKHTFYGIASFQCMEMTPSLACANKCVFCWRHHKNPVGTHWRWQMDEPDFLVSEAVNQHRQMIKQFRGVPGVQAERFLEASTIRHCALSLVGEPIIYPKINEFIGELHKRNISSFLVTNAQFPDKMDSLQPVTQMYISVDAGTKESLKAVDRPLFSDFWERFLASIDSLSRKGQRTVFRLTLIRSWNMEEIQNYATLVARGKPSFIEIKGVTYCGTSEASPLTMQNVPFHQDVVKFSMALCKAVNEILGFEMYDAACEHEHSCCMLLADVKTFKPNGVWHTWIDYAKFHELVSSGQHFTSADYIAPTPSWALFNSPEHGFDPEELRFNRKKTTLPVGGC
jgi:tRNA wybutosine-synthesizing protein 1